jgi:hypothetical protein
LREFNSEKERLEQLRLKQLADAALLAQ